MAGLILALQIFQLLLVLAAFALVLYLSYIMISFKNFLPFVPTTHKTALRMAELLDLKPGERACDLGSGSGTLILALAKRYPANELVGYEISGWLRVWSRIKIKLLAPKAKKVKIINQDLFTVNLSGYNAGAFFLLPKVSEQLVPQFSAMPVGTRLVTNLFPLPNLEAAFTEQKIIEHNRKIFLYTKIK